MEFTAAGAKKFADVTIKWVGQQMPILLDNKVISSPVIQTPITEGKGQIGSGFTTESASELVILLRAGSACAFRRMETVTWDRFWKGINRSQPEGWHHGIIGVVLFMLAYYRLPGGIANFSPRHLRGPRVGGARPCAGNLDPAWHRRHHPIHRYGVDANVIIFERIKEEAGCREMSPSRGAGRFCRALRRSLMRNITTLITALVLFNLGKWAH